jgi:hypothetical protein
VLPTFRETADYLHRTQPRVARARAAASRAAAPLLTPEPEPRGPELVLALDRADEFPALIEQYEDGDWRDKRTWHFDVRLDLVGLQGTRSLYRCLWVAADDQAAALQELRVRACNAQVVTVYAIWPPLSPVATIEIADLNARLDRFRRRYPLPASAEPAVIAEALRQLAGQLEL